MKDTTCVELEGVDMGLDPTPWKLTKNIGILSNTGPDPLKITKFRI